MNKHPRQHESDGLYHHIFPHEARVRGLTYQTELFCAVEIKKIKYGEKNMRTGIAPVISEETLFQNDKVQIARIPVMVRSKFCHLSQLTKDQIVAHRECRYDQGGYFIINGGERVIVAQERMAYNIVLVFNKKQPSKFSWVSEIRSAAENSGRPPQQFCVKLCNKTKSGGAG